MSRPGVKGMASCFLRSAGTGLLMALLIYPRTKPCHVEERAGPSQDGFLYF